MVNVGLILEEQGNTEDAKKWYRRAMEMGNMKTAGNLAFLYESEGKLKEAEEALLKASEAGDADSFECRLLYGSKT